MEEPCLRFRGFLRFALVLIVCFAAGCTVQISEGPPPGPPPPPPPSGSNHIPEMKAALSLSLQSQRTAALGRIAEKCLTEEEQSYLVDAVLKAGLLRSSTERILVTLIENPCFVEPTRIRLLELLPELDLLSSTRERLLRLLMERAPA